MYNMLYLSDLIITVEKNICFQGPCHSCAKASSLLCLGLASVVSRARHINAEALA